MIKEERILFSDYTKYNFIKILKYVHFHIQMLTFQGERLDKKMSLSQSPKLL